MILGAVFGIIGWLTVPETYVPVLLKRKALRLRLETRNWAFHSKLEEELTSEYEEAVCGALAFWSCLVACCGLHLSAADRLPFHLTCNTNPSSRRPILRYSNKLHA